MPGRRRCFSQAVTILAGPSTRQTNRVGPHGNGCCNRGRSCGRSQGRGTRQSPLIRLLIQLRIFQSRPPPPFALLPLRRRGYCRRSAVRSRCRRLGGSRLGEAALRCEREGFPNLGLRCRVKRSTPNRNATPCHPGRTPLPGRGIMVRSAQGGLRLRRRRIWRNSSRQLLLQRIPLHRELFAPGRLRRQSRVPARLQTALCARSRLASRGPPR